MTVTEANVGDTVATDFSSSLSAGVLISGAMTTINLVTMTIYNASGAAQPIGNGTRRADAWRHKDLWCRTCTVRVCAACQGSRSRQKEPS